MGQRRRGQPRPGIWRPPLKERSASRRWRIYRFDEVTSTNETVLEAGERGDPEWTVHIARRQSRGRGRGSHTWWSPPDRGLWMSVLLRPRSSPGRIGGLALVAGIAVRSALESLGAGALEVFWPNDLQYDGRKLGGILGEVRSRGTPPRPLIALGIGINIDLTDVDVPTELRGAISSLADAGVRERDPEAIAERILEHLEPRYRAFDGGAAVPSLIGDGIAGLRRPVRVRVPPGAPWTGTTVGIGPDGELLVDREGGGRERLLAAEVDYDAS